MSGTQHFRDEKINIEQTNKMKDLIRIKNKAKGMLWLVGIMSLLWLASCSDTDMDCFTAGELQGSGEKRVTLVHLRADALAGWEGHDSVTFCLEDPAERRSLRFTGNLRHEERTRGDGVVTCGIVIGESDIPDGTYFLKVKGEGLPEFGTRKVLFSANVGQEVEAGAMSYDDLGGNGSPNDPYRINDEGDFLTMIWYLEEDPDHGYGKYFLQTASFDVPHRSQIIDGHIYAPVQFSGTYDGGGHELRSLTYQGGSNEETDSDTGLFEMLFSATVRNLVISRAMIVNAASRVGLVAGRAYGECTLENITFDGTVMASGTSIGGLVGESFATLTLRNIRIGAFSLTGSESATQNAGLLVGEQFQNDLTVDGVSTPEHVFSITGCDCVGGIVGQLNVNHASIRNVTLEHSVDQETNGVKIVSASGKYTGGLIGNLQITHSIEIANVSVKAPVRGTQDVGGLVGHAFVTNATVDGALVSSVVNGEVSVGGLFGYLGYIIPESQVTLKCDSRPVRLVVKSSADAGVKGNTYVGGIAGYYDADGGEMIFKGKAEVAVNIKGNSNIGGAFGYADRLEKFNPYGILFSSSTMRIEATGSNAGGIAGLAHESTVDGGQKVNTAQQSPQLPSCFSGVVTASRNAGGIVGRQEGSGSVSGLACSATVTATDSDAGGIVGWLEHDVNNCINYGRVDAAESAGGIYGATSGKDLITLSDCVNYGDVSGDSNAGGIGGYTRLGGNPRLSIYNCYNTGHIRSANAGGIAGFVSSDNTDRKNKEFDIRYCGNAGTVEGSGGDCVGGIVAVMLHRHGYVGLCANKGEVKGPGQKAVAGIVGHMGDGGGGGTRYNYGLVTQCINYGTISSSDGNTRVGGIVGIMEYGFSMDYGHKITDCANYGDLPSKQNHDNGGILGYTERYTNTYRTFNKGKVSHGNAIIGDHQGSSLFHHSHNYFLEGSGKDWPSSTKVSTDDLCKENTYESFDFKTIWGMSPPSGPDLRNCPSLDF